MEDTKKDGDVEKQKVPDVYLENVEKQKVLDMSLENDNIQEVLQMEKEFREETE